MHPRRCGPMLLAGVTALLLGACAAPEPRAEGEKVAITPRDCEPQTGTRVPASCTKGRGSSSGAVQTMERPTRIDGH
jgi:hypothetical protein